MSKIITVLFVVVLTTLSFSQYNIIIDGDVTDWDTNDGGYDGSQLAVHGTGYFNGQWIYKGQIGDQRTDTGNNADNDITEVRIGADDTYLYLAIKMQNIENGGDYVNICISLDNDQNNGDAALNWIGDDSQTTLANANQFAERNITIHDVTPDLGTNLQFELFADDESNWYAPPTPGSEISISTTNEVIEAKIALSDLNISSNSTISVSLASFVNGNNGYNNDVDATQNIDNSDAIDVMTPGATPGDNAWTRDLNDGNIGIFGLIDLSQSPLPVELVSFSVTSIGNSVKLNWRTETELNNYGFEIKKMEMRRPEMEWSTIGFVEGYGNSNSAKEYSFIDNSVETGKYAYRLKQIDNDGSYEYSNVIEIDLGIPVKFVLNQNFPNPFNPKTVISYEIPLGGAVKIMIYDELGNEVTTLVNEFKRSGNSFNQF